jgi:Pregnancy-associated plasma protein-A
MRRISSARPVLFGVLITLASVRSAWGCGGHDADNELHENRNLREIRRRHRDKGEVFPFCRTVVPTKGEVRTSMTAVTEFYRQADRDDDAKRRLQGGPIQIKVNFVVVSDSSGKGNVSQAMVVDQIAVLNAAFRPDFSFNLTSTQRVSNNTYFSFASTYPDPFSPAELALATRYRKGGTETLNIYSLLPLFPGNANLTLLGYAFYPYPFLHPGVADGAYVHYETLPGGGFADYAKGAVSAVFFCLQSATLNEVAGLTFSRFLVKTLVHQVGHWLGLFHTYEGGCAFPGDGISDTPPQAVPSRSCNTSLNTCPGDSLLDPVTNFMNYVPDACVTNFTVEQRKVMVATWYRYRSPPPPAPAPIPAPSAPAKPSGMAPTAKPPTARATNAPASHFCGTEGVNQNEVRVNVKTIEDFYKEGGGDGGWRRRLQTGPIVIDVNFVVVSNETGYGNVTNETVNAQIAVLNAAFSPDFSFRLTSLQRVSNNSLFEIPARDPHKPTSEEVLLKRQYRKGGTETLNVYSASPVYLYSTEHEPGECSILLQMRHYFRFLTSFLHQFQPLDLPRFLIHPSLFQAWTGSLFCSRPCLAAGLF